MIFHNNKMVFFHPGKTGGTSIEFVLTKQFLNKKFSDLNAKKADYDIMYGYCKKHNVFLHHADVRFYENNNIYIPKDYTCAVSIRRPFEKVLSAYYYNGYDKKYKFQDFVVKQLERIVNINSDFARNHFCPQTYYYRNGYHIIKLENIKEDCAKLNIIIQSTKHCKTKASILHQQYLDAYTLPMKDVVRSLYKEDFKTFEY